MTETRTRSPVVVRHATANGQKELADRRDATAQLRRLVDTVAAAADIIGWQEIERPAHKAAVRTLTGHGWKTHWFDGSAASIPISWRTDRFHLVRWGQVLLHRGQRGVTPDRWFVWVVLRDHQSGELVVRWNTHLISQAWTTHRERRPRWLTSQAKIVRQNRRLLRRYGAVVGGGDFNRSHWAPDGTTGLWASHGTHGDRVFYDALTIAGHLGVDGPVRRIPTPSDHDALVATIVRRAP